MKAIIVTNNNLKIEGKLRTSQSYIIALDVDKQDIDSQTIRAYYDEEISVTEYPQNWHVIVSREKVKSIEFVD
jgi:hypothetical protein